MTETIAAVSTGQGVSAIGIIRLSGSRAIEAAEYVFLPRYGTRLSDASDRKMYYGQLQDENGDVIDMCMCTVSRAPNSYTGEDTAEFHCHGSPVVLSECLKALFAIGVRQAKPGEFTKRAFLNGRLDLSQAEAVIDLIEAETPLAVKNAAGQLRGAVSARLGGIYSRLLDIMAHFHAVIDYPDEDIDDFELREYLGILNEAQTKLASLYATFERGRYLLREGIPATLAGRPNTGKSSLLNALLGYDRAIVTSVPGTTRDTIEEKISVGDVLLKIIDTAGIRKTDDEIEQMGVLRTFEALSTAGLVLIVLDGSEPLKDEDFETINAVPDGAAVIAVINKSDLEPAFDERELDTFGFKTVRVSAATSAGLDELENEIKALFPELTQTAGGEVITNARQAEAILRASESIKAAFEALQMSVTPDAVLTEVEAALSAIGEVLGKTLREDVTSRIFERFCVGK